MFRRAWQRFVDWLRSCRLQQPPSYSHRDRQHTEAEQNASDDSGEPKAGVWRAPAIELAIREIREEQEEHQARERDFWARQLRAAHCLNHITLGGAIIAVGALIFVGLSVLVAKRSADDAREALHASQRPWAVAQKIEPYRRLPDNVDDIYCHHIGYEVTIGNTGNSVATRIIINSRALQFQSITTHFNDVKTELKKLWANSSKDKATGIVLAPGQTSKVVRCPWYSDGADPTAKDALIGNYIVIGYIEYFDQFDLLHHTRFAFKPDMDSIQPWDGKTFVIYNDYQEAD
jgi:hypothetical protein